MRLSRMVSGAAALLVTALAVPTAASASAIPWQPYRTAPWTDAPGAVCTFGVSTSIVTDYEQFRTLASYPNGNPELQEFRGPLFIRYTNQSTGASVVEDLSGYAWFHYGQNGEITAYVASHIGLTVPVGNVGFPAGEWDISGQSVVNVSSTGAITVDLVHATTENLCQALS